jgi:predicted RNA polymerase sigma factor
VLGLVMRRIRDFAAAEDAVQEALIAAANQWPRDGLPANPRGWLLHVALRRLTDQLRADSARRKREAIVVSLIPPEDQLVLAVHASLDGEPAGDDTLELLFTCCHPALSTASAIALTLRAVGGLTTLEVAKAFLVPEATMAQRISRAKQTIKASGVAFERPGSAELASRLSAVTHVLYLIFNEGYAASTGDDVHRQDLAHEALRLIRLLQRLVPDDAEVAGLLALMLLTDARRPARTGPAGELIPLDRQDRARWDRGAITEGIALITRTLQASRERGALGPYQVQAAIAAVHDEAASSDATDWPQIVGLYEVLQSMSDNPLLGLNHAVALAMVHGPAAGLARLDQLGHDPRLREHHRLDAVRAHLLERAGERERAIVLYRRAAERTASRAERDYLLLHATRLSEGTS